MSRDGSFVRRISGKASKPPSHLKPSTEEKEKKMTKANTNANEETRIRALIDVAKQL
jgi:hypothetical protein